MPKYRITKVIWQQKPGELRKAAFHNAGTVFAPNVGLAPEIFCERKNTAQSVSWYDGDTGVYMGFHFEAEEIAP